MKRKGERTGERKERGEEKYYVITDTGFRE